MMRPAVHCILHTLIGQFSDGQLLRSAVSRIESHNSSSPLFLYVAFQAPHGPIMKPPATYLNMYQGTLHRHLWHRGSLNRHATVSVGGKGGDQ